MRVYVHTCCGLFMQRQVCFRVFDGEGGMELQKLFQLTSNKWFLVFLSLCWSGKVTLRCDNIKTCGQWK